MFNRCILRARNFPGGASGKELANAGDTREASSISGSGRFPWRGKWQPTPVFLPGESHGQRSLAGYSPWGRKGVRHECKDLTHTQGPHLIVRIETRYMDDLILSLHPCSCLEIRLWISSLACCVVVIYFFACSLLI